MNYCEVYIFLMCCFHNLIWIVAILGSLFSKEIAKFNMLFFLPLIFVVHTILPTHPITHHKIRYIKNHKNEFPEPKKIYHFNRNYIYDLQRIAKIEGVKYEEILKYAYILKELDYKLGINFFLDKIRIICDFSHRNPLDVCGLLILGYIVSLISYLMRE